MYFVDTNIFVRYLTKDDPAKAYACLELFKQAERNETVLFTSETVIAEVAYVLSSPRLYGLTHTEIRERLVPLLTVSGLKLPDKTVCLRALEIYAAYAVDFEDALAVAHMERQQITAIYSYDRDYDKIAAVQRMEPASTRFLETPPGANPMNTQQILEKQRKHLWPNHLLYYTEPLPLERGDGLYVWDVEGNKYLDFFAGILTTSVGHNNPHVNKRVHEQVDKLLHTSTLYPNPVHVELAERLSEITPGNLDTFYFGASGTDADETAVQIAKIATGHQEIIALRHGYSGKSPMGMALTGQSPWRIGGTQIAGIKHALNPYCYRCPLKMTYPSCGVACAEDVEDVIRTTTSGKIAAFLAEPIQGVGGFVTAPPEYFTIVEEITHRYGGLLIIDEVQTGFGRTGEYWFAIERSGVVPDVITMAKGIANGMPLSAVATTPEIAATTVGAGLTLSTFGGNPVACAAALGTLEAMHADAPPARTADVGGHLRAGLERLQEKYPLIGDVRGMGLMQGVEMVRDRTTKEPAAKEVAALFEVTKKLGLLIGKGGLYSNTLRIAPPLTATKEHVDEALEKLDYAFAQVQENA